MQCWLPTFCIEIVVNRKNICMFQRTHKVLEVFCVFKGYEGSVQIPSIKLHGVIKEIILGWGYQSWYSYTDVPYIYSLKLEPFRVQMAQERYHQRRCRIHHCQPCSPNKKVQNKTLSIIIYISLVTMFAVLMEAATI